MQQERDSHSKLNETLSFLFWMSIERGGGKRGRRTRCRRRGRRRARAEGAAGVALETEARFGSIFKFGLGAERSEADSDAPRCLDGEAEEEEVEE